MSELQNYARRFRDKAQAAGFSLGEEKPVQYGLKIEVMLGAEKVPVTLYEGKKGCSTVVGGKSGPLKTRIEELVNGPSLFPMNSTDTRSSALSSAPSPATGNLIARNQGGVYKTPPKPYGFEQHEGYEAGWIGTDESGKGDVFGPLVVAAVAVNPEIISQLEQIGVKDCKQLTDKKVTALAAQIRQIAKGRFQELTLLPARYNALYADLKREGKNLNHLLAWAHARVIEDTLETAPCSFAIADQFANVRVIESRLMARGRAIVLIQKTHAEQNIAVAAASVLARDSFLRGMESLEQRFGMNFPKGAGSQVEGVIRQFVAKHGKEALPQVGKTHFRTFEGVLVP